MNRLSRGERRGILRSLIEGVSIRSIERIFKHSRNTISRLLLKAGATSEAFLDSRLVNIPSQYLALDEQYSFVHRKEVNTTPSQKRQGEGTIWLWVAIDMDTRLVPSWLLGDRSGENATTLLADLRARVSTERPQLVSDQFNAYPEAVRATFPSAHYGQIGKVYGTTLPSGGSRLRRGVIGVKKVSVQGEPVEEILSNGVVERFNLSTRHFVKRFTRKTCAFSKSFEHHSAAVNLHMFAYNFIRVHRTLKKTPAMAAGYAGRPWRVDDLCYLIERNE